MLTEFSKSRLGKPKKNRERKLGKRFMAFNY
jgi:hypothetical protein